MFGSGWPKPDPLSSFSGRLIQILMDLGRSNAPGALAWSGSIRSVGLKFFRFSWIFVAIHTSVCDIWTPMHTKISCKKSWKLPHVSWCIFNCFVAFSHFGGDRKHVRYFYLFWFVCFCVLGGFSCIILDPIFATWCWYLIHDFMVCLVLSSLLILVFHKINWLFPNPFLQI